MLNLSVRNDGDMSRPEELVVRELSRDTWPDFQRLFRTPGEWGACWCVYYQRAGPVPKQEREGLTPGARAERNRRDKEGLVRDGRSRGVIVYEGADPVGWCQYGLADELPRIDAGRKYKALGRPSGDDPLWRITCLSVDRAHRRRGVAEVALDAALDSIVRGGGGVVEAYPVTRWGALSVWFGTQGMFERRGFKVVAPFGKSNVLMRKKVGRGPSPRP